MLGKIKSLCTPAMVYFLISITTLFYMILNNLGNKRTLCMGDYDCPVDNVYVIYLIKMVYLLFVTIVLDSLCNNGYGGISWFLVFFPVMFYFVALGFFMIKQNSTVLVVNESEY